MTPKSTLAVAFAVMLAPCGGQACHAAELQATHYRCDSTDVPADSGARTIAVRAVSVSPGDLVGSQKYRNAGSWRFDGRRAIAYGKPSNSEGFAENFTWEGFFLSPSSNSVIPETGIADRLISQFAFEKGDWTRLAIGLVADQNGKARLGVEIEGFEGRTFGMGERPVAPDRWHHFALVHEGTSAAATIRWFLDYEMCGELFLGGQANQNTLRPPGGAPITIGARLRRGQTVNRGFDGFIDEVRFSPRPLKRDEFLRTDQVAGMYVGSKASRAADHRDVFWKNRHRWARRQISHWSQRPTAFASIDGHFRPPARPTDDAAFLRRLSLTVRGRIPSLGEVERFLADSRPDRRERVIDRMLASPEWADAWVGYWQDVLAENPSVVFPTLNNSGPFRKWIYELFRENVPFDRFATELILMDGSGAKAGTEDGPAGFALATGNDAPMAMRSHVAMKAFAAVDLKCARCHDSPVDEHRQSDLFLLAAYMNDGPLEVPASSVVAVEKAKTSAIIKTSLSPGQTIQPAGLMPNWLPDPGETVDLYPIERGRHRAELAALITSPRNPRFSDVLVNRVWQRYFGSALVDPVDNWNAMPKASNPGLLRFLSESFIASGYDVKALARMILRSKTWQGQREARLRMSAEQLVDSLFVAVGKDFEAETMGVHATDPGAAQLPQPHRAWQFAALPNERDRPALGMPVNQTIVDVMATFGWNGSRQQPRTTREQTTSVLQPLILFNGLMSQRIARLSEQSAVTELCLQDMPLPVLVDKLFLMTLSRRPDDEERQRCVAYLRPGFANRYTGRPAQPVTRLSTFQPDWRKHLEPGQTRLMLDAQKRVSRGEPPTQRLTSDFRERAEDVVWALINSPEFVVIP